MKQNVELVMHCQYFSLFEHAEGHRVMGNARMRPCS
jgi:hypothetical protein